MADRRAIDVGPVVVVVARTRGSTPRDVGARMAVSADESRGSIGGGHLEYEAIRLARALPLGATGHLRFVLGASLGQCCGGEVELAFVPAACWPGAPMVASGTRDRRSAGLPDRMTAGLTDGGAEGQIGGEGQLGGEGQAAGPIDRTEGAVGRLALTHVVTPDRRNWQPAPRFGDGSGHVPGAGTGIGSGPVPETGSGLVPGTGISTGTDAKTVAAPTDRFAPPPTARVAPAPALASPEAPPIALDDQEPPTLLIGNGSPGPRVLLCGAGHVGVALARLLDPLDCRLDWIDDREDLAPLPPGPGPRWRDVDPVAAVAAAPAGTHVVVMTHDHALDYDIIAGALARDDLPFVGLIGSMTKRRRFVHRLRSAGLSEAAIGRLVCPLGQVQTRDKAPEAIAIFVAAQLLAVWDAAREDLAPTSRVAVAA